MTVQEVFDKVTKHLLEQNHKSEFDGSCRYRSPDGTMCAIGCLITDEEYSEYMEDTDVESLMNLGMLLHLKSHVELLRELQFVHDICYVNDWETELRYLAQKFNLEWNYVSE